ncbi:SDR family oxidoreductase [Pseudenhygromyxa sp. WMMC2535]|uniref:SDR family NAD(P)-dependent oxidoreductase n=1 Tax=Pseudenhygromyxa sp. WMMC2535 TaxID=2712867 RepID=UPI001557D101|nr:SDR family NAD(P)-dependent oxidoreductase [Pseudenhygromyxa sp. WMMC2535]NVB38689.1 SDR family oxidoreductase [Pseudenhygromyxa sp. WMMC2535]
MTRDDALTLNDFRDKVVLITGGTKGIGRACALAFARLGAQCWLTNRWGSADEDELREAFARVGARAPVIVEADASKKRETKALIERMREAGVEGVDVFISNVAMVVRGEGLDAHSERALLKSLEYSAWPFVDYLHQLEAGFGRYPEYAIAMSSDGPDQHYPHYDYVAVAKSVLETFVRYMSTHLREQGVKVNALRTRQVPTDSYAQIFGEDNTALAARFAEFSVTPEEVAATTLGLCSGLFDSFGGQVLQLDRGAAFVDNVMTMGRRLLGESDAGEAKPEPSPRAPAPAIIELGSAEGEGAGSVRALMRRRLEGKAVIITGGTKGIGLACGLAFGSCGARTYLTNRWGSADEGAIASAFAEVGAPAPVILEADASLDEDTASLMERVHADVGDGGLEVLISNVSFAHISQEHHDLSFKGLKRSLTYSAWPFVSYLQHAKQRFGRLPRYAIGMSSRGPEYFLPGYDFVAASKAVMETFCRYLTSDLLDEDIRINVLRANPVETESLEATFGPEFAPFCKKWYAEGFFIQPREVAEAALALCSGLMDGVRGQVLLLDRGFGFSDNVVRLFTERERYGL